MKKNHTTIIIPVKPYVKRYLETNYGDPVDFTSNQYFYNHVRRMIVKPSFRRDRMYSDKMKCYSTFVRVLISADDIERYGCEISKTDVVRFSELFAFHVKFLMRSMVGIRVALGTPINESISKFQDRYNFDETVWAFESIKKDYYRNGPPYRIEYEDEIYTKFEKIFLDNMSHKRDNLPKFEGYKKLIETR